ncbi:OprD family outer membrane porin [Shewanella youngdeokensis]|uniref:OprD family outer membrane porin n=1 Tax=Shewanella youngdeokensis TaxID=2999068 RepID=A0ABZ0JUN5_9GAMM|nr:OprD family outer membrane porin [Shewanella sp. DAU334]
MKKTIIALALTSAFAAPAMSYTFDPADLKDGFISDSKSYIRVKVENYNYDNKFNDGNGGRTELSDNETPLYIEYGFSSGYFKNWLGFDVAAFGTTMLDGLSEYRHTNLVDTGSYGLGNTSADGKTQQQIGVAYLKTKFNLDIGTLKAGYGKKRRYTSMYNEKVVRVNEGSSRGLDVSLDLGQHKVWATVIDRFQNFGQAEYLRDIMTYTMSEQIDFLALTGVNGKFGDVNYKFEYATADDYIQKVFYQADYTFKSIKTNVMLRGENLFDTGSKFEYDDAEAGKAHFVIRTNLSKDTTMSIKGTKIYGSDFFQFWGNPGTISRSMLPNVMLGNEIPLFEGEEALMLRFDQKLDTLVWPGLSAYAQYWKGWNAKHIVGYKRSEYILMVKQDFGKLHSALAGLSMKYQYSRHDGAGVDDGYRSSGNRVDNTYWLSDDHYRRLTLDYRLNF